MSATLKDQESAELSARVQPLLQKAREIYAKILAGERGMEKRRDALILRAWEFGKVLTAMKEEVGHGHWLFWLGANWNELSERTSQRCMALFKDNATLSNPQNFADLEPDSIRKFMFGYVPAKERPTLTGNQSIAPHPHQLTFVNSFFKFDQRIRAGLQDAPPVEVLRRDLEAPIRRMAELCGPEWVKSLLG